MRFLTQIKMLDLSLKIDVEGAEYEIMHDIAVRFGEAFERVDMIFGDTHPLKSGEFGFIKWLEILRPFNYEVMSAKPLDNGCCEFIMLSRDSFV